MISFVLRTKKIAAYFRGVIREDYFPFVGKKMFHCDCLGYAGGGPGASLLEVIHFKGESEQAVIDQLVAFRKEHSYILELKA